ncbi:MAG: ATP-binding protein [Pseudomonadota bacterium]
MAGKQEGANLRSADFRAKLDTLRKSEPVLGREFVCRTMIVVFTAAIGWLVMELDILPFWVLAYYTAVVVEKMLLARSVLKPSRELYWAVVGVSFGIACIFAFLPIYLWNMEGEIWKFAAMVALVGATLNVFLIRARTIEVAIAYLVPIASVPFLLSCGFFTGNWGGPEFWSAVILSGCFALYLGLSVRESNRIVEEVRLTQAKFHQAQKTEALGTLTAGISHDFNNLLSVILGSLELLKSRRVPQIEEGEIVEEAIAATNRGAELTKTLLAYAKGSELDSTLVDPVEIIDTIVGLGRRVLMDTIEVNSQTDVQSGSVLVDRSLLESALLNLFLNARDAIQSSGRIDLGLRETVYNGREAYEFSVHDTGVGIPDDQLERVAEPFFSTKAFGEGSGLGLAMVSGFVEQSGGLLRLESSPGQGTSAYILLPKAQSNPNSK